MSEFLKRLVRYIKKDWNKVVLWVSILGAIGVYLLPPLRNQTHWFIAFCFMGTIALIFTLLDIRDTLLSLSTPQRYKSMDAAEPQLVKEIVRRSRQVSRGHPLEVKIIGGRLRNIRRILIQLFTEVQNGDLHLGPVSFIIYKNQRGQTFILRILSVQGKWCFARQAEWTCSKSFMAVWCHARIAMSICGDGRQVEMVGNGGSGERRPSALWGSFAH